MQKENRLSLAYLTTQGAHPIEQIEAAAAAGFHSAGLRLVAPLGVTLEHDVVGNTALIADIKLACRNTGVGLLDGELLTLSASSEVEQWFPALDAAAELGMRYMQITSEDNEHQRVVERFGRLCDRAAKLGIHMAIEFMRWRSLNSIEAALRLVDEAGRDSGGILVDALHLSRSGGSPAAVAAIPAQRLLYLQLCDAPRRMPQDNEGFIREARGGRLYPGDGSLWLEALLDALPAGVDISVEVPNADDIGRTVPERAKLAAESARAFLDRYRNSRMT
jgi:sugar phosphate isomerase/epimerase